jgi:hypothetical protein
MNYHDVNIRPITGLNNNLHFCLSAALLLLRDCLLSSRTALKDEAGI